MRGHNGGAQAVKIPLERNNDYRFHLLRQGGIDEELFEVISGFEADEHSAQRLFRVAREPHKIYGSSLFHVCP